MEDMGDAEKAAKRIFSPVWSALGINDPTTGTTRLQRDPTAIRVWVCVSESNSDPQVAGFFFAKDSPLNGGCKVTYAADSYRTNIAGEVVAAIMALERIWGHVKFEKNWNIIGTTTSFRNLTRIVITTSSRFLLDAFTKKVWQWEEDSWGIPTGEPVSKNWVRYKEFHELITRFERENIAVNFLRGSGVEVSLEVGYVGNELSETIKLASRLGVSVTG